MNSTRIPVITAVFLAASLISQRCTTRNESRSTLPDWVDNPPVSEDTLAAVGTASSLAEALGYSLGELAGLVTASTLETLSKSYTMVTFAGVEEPHSEEISRHLTSYSFGHVTVKSMTKRMSESVKSDDSLAVLTDFFQYVTQIDYEQEGNSHTVKIFAQESGVGEESEMSHYLSIEDNGITTHDVINYLRDLGVKIEIARDEEHHYVLTRATIADWFDPAAQLSLEEKKHAFRQLEKFGETCCIEAPPAHEAAFGVRLN